jgi:aspartyl-tRNA(Asn)/glutamyl-tRNA(Gln) amidotransferase subunit C
MDNVSKDTSIPAIDRAMVKHIAYLIRLKITEEEATLFSQQFSNIIEYFNLLNEIYTPERLENNQGYVRKNVFREDQVTPSMSREDFLANAPQHDGAFVKVPHVFDDR